MTNTIAIEAEQSTSEHPALGVIEHIDPHSLVLDTNVRDEAALGVRFVASIKEHGVLTPIAAVRDRDGQLRVRCGQRRTLAAREAGLASVPVYVRTAAAGEDDKAQLWNGFRSRSWRTTSAHSSPRFSAPRGIQQMIDAGVSITRVAKIHRTNAPRPPLAASPRLSPSLSPLTRRLAAIVMFVDQ